MHPVVKHLLARKNQKVPINDGRKIALVNFGGFMTGICSAGAMLALVEMGFEDSFDSIYTISSGFHNACSFLSGDGKRNISVYYEDLCHGDFFKPQRLWKVIDVQHLADILKYDKPINVENLLNKHTKLFVRLKEKNCKNEKYVEVHDIPKSKFYSLIKAAASVPYLAPGYIKIGNKEYKDPIWAPSQIVNHLKHVLDTPATDILVIYNHYSQYAYVKKYLKGISKNRVLQIHPKKNLSLSRFEKRPEILKQVAMLMGKSVKNVFGLRKGFKLTEFMEI